MKHEDFHRWDITVAEAVQIQLRLGRRLIIERNLTKIEFVAGADVAFRGKMAYGAVVVLSFPGLETAAQACACREIGFPYIPGLLSFREEPGPVRGCWKAILDNDGRSIGTTLRTKNNVKPVFISPGHKTGFEQSIELILSLGSGFRIPEPLRRAHHLSLLAASPAYSSRD